MLRYAVKNVKNQIKDKRIYQFRPHRNLWVKRSKKSKKKNKSENNNKKNRRNKREWRKDQRVVKIKNE